MNPQDTVKNNDDVNCLLIWPPLIIENTIMPLSIPSLLAYLKKHHINTTEVFDANSFYKQLGLFGLLFRIHKGYKSFVRRIYKRPNLKAKLPFNIYVNDNIGKRGQPKNLNKQRLFSQ
ncbi:hypothetical protein KKF04_03930, partial [Patescibacteria group bacterium]|nr:hypothetical protein [Patescibacteria group bacterium]